MFVDTKVAGRRLEAIARLGLVERARDPGLTALVRVAAYVAGGGRAAVHVFDERHQHRIAGVGAPLGVHPRDDTLCRLVVEGRAPIVCTDATAEARFRYSPFVTGPEPIRFYASVPLWGSDGSVTGTLCTWDTVARQIDAEQIARLEDLATQAVAYVELTRLAVELGHAASHDPLTGAVNRLVLADRLSQAFARRLRNGADILVGLIDIDDFKSINDGLGHEAGDEVLVTIANRLTGALRPHDTVARLGGDEFAVVVELEPTAMTTADLARRLSRCFDEPVLLRSGTCQVAASVGCAVAQAGDDVRSTLSRADREMYRRKVGRTGRPNRLGALAAAA